MSQLSNSLAYLGRSLFNADAFLNGSIDEFRVYNNALTALDVANSYATGPVPLDLLELEVNTFTGAVNLKNQHTSPLSFDYYKVSSPGGQLNPSGWTSLDDQNVDAIGPGEGQSWDESGGADANKVAELYLLGASTLAPTATRQLGQLFDPAAAGGKRHNGDLIFQYAIQGDDLRQGVVRYVTPPPLPGDYNDNGGVDAADYAVWRDHLNTSFQLPNEVAGVTPGMVTTADYEQWKARFGNSLFRERRRISVRRSSRARQRHFVCTVACLVRPKVPISASRIGVGSRFICSANCVRRTFIFRNSERGAA